MRVVDLTHPLSQDTPVYPGTPGPCFEIVNTYGQDGFQETRMILSTHTGTHMDAPAHLFADGTTLDQLPITQFVGSALVIDCSDLRPGQRISMQRVQQHRAQADVVDFLLFYTGWERHWGTQQYFGAYPYIDDEIAQYMIRTRKKGIGLDTIGLDPISDTHLTLHRKLLCNNDFIIIENLANLKAIGEQMFTLCALPIKCVAADGSPIRAIALVDE